MMITRSTSIIGIRLISGSSFRVRANLITEYAAAGIRNVLRAPRRPVSLPAAPSRPRSLRPCRGNGGRKSSLEWRSPDRSPCCTVPRKSGGRLRAEDFDHADHGAEQTHQRTDRCDRPERRQEALQLVRHRATGLFDRVLHHVARTLVVAKARGQYLAERRVLRELLEHVLAHSLLLVCDEHPLQQAARNDLLLAKNHEPFDDKRHCDDRHGE